MRKSFFILTITVSVLCTGCATIISGSRQLVKFNSTPASATVYIDEVEVGKTPYEMKLKRNKEHHVMIKLDGYRTYETNLKKGFNAWYIGNIAIGGLVGLIIDPITGAMYKLSPNAINAEMEQGTTFKGDKRNIYVAVSLKIDPHWEKVGQLEKL
ncbi:PEGA domain-containing protein [Niabella hirudinis]|uniref:PEGA domain-containing protein n=1 Tax=Niabella hirudinis TaxID=1285929 RepID=UPI003EB8808B